LQTSTAFSLFLDVAGLVLHSSSCDSWLFISWLYPSYTVELVSVCSINNNRLTEVPTAYFSIFERTLFSPTFQTEALQQVLASHLHSVDNWNTLTYLSLSILLTDNAQSAPVNTTTLLNLTGSNVVSL
jgi:hypothetical protein